MTAPTEEGTVELPKFPLSIPDVHALIREAGGIVHSDGNIFFTRAEQFILAAVLCGEVSRSPVVGAVGGEPTEEQKDAARYRWLRAGQRRRQGEKLVGGHRSIDRDKMRAAVVFDYWCMPDELDAAIDAAMGGIGVSPTGSPEGEVSNG